MVKKQLTITVEYDEERYPNHEPFKTYLEEMAAVIQKRLITTECSLDVKLSKSMRVIRLWEHKS